MAENEDVNQELASQIEPTVKTIILALIVVGIVLDLITWRYRWCAKWILYYEVVSLCVQSLVPFRFGDFRTLVTINSIMTTYILNSCAVGQSTIVCTVCLLII